MGVTQVAVSGYSVLLLVASLVLSVTKGIAGRGLVHWSASWVVVVAIHGAPFLCQHSWHLSCRCTVGCVVRSLAVLTWL